MALLGGGGHATRVAIPTGQLMPLPDNLSFTEGGAIQAYRALERGGVFGKVVISMS